MSAADHRWPDSTDILGQLRDAEAALHRANVENDELRAALEVEIAGNEAKAGWARVPSLRAEWKTANPNRRKVIEAEIAKIVHEGVTA